MEDIAKLVKPAILSIVGFSTSRVVAQVIKNNANMETKIDKIATFVASVALGGIAAKASRKHVESEIESIRDSWQKASTKSEEETPTES